jgi:glutathione S-transferase
MKLYFAPGACSLADHIALHEAGLEFEHERVDLKAKKTASGADFAQITAKGYVPVLILDNGETLTENVAMLDWIAQQGPALAPQGTLGRTRLLEMLAYISTEIHKSFAPFFQGGSDEEKRKAADKLGKRFGWIASQMKGDFLFGSQPGVADCYLFVMLLWAGKNKLAVEPQLAEFRDRMTQRPAVQLALTHEGLQ